jgi:hypothetical protein
MKKKTTIRRRVRGLHYYIYKYTRHRYIIARPFCKAPGPVRSIWGMWSTKLLGIRWPLAGYVFSALSGPNWFPHDIETAVRPSKAVHKKKQVADFFDVKGQSQELATPNIYIFLYSLYIYIYIHIHIYRYIYLCLYAWRKKTTIRN